MEKALDNHPELLEKAVGIFRDLTDDAKIQFVKTYQELAENTENKEEIQAKAMIKSSHIEIDKAKRGKYICDKTAKRFKENFDDSKYKDEKTGRYDLPKLEAKFKLLTKNEAVTEQKNRNLAAYFKEHQKYLDSLAKAQEANPKLSQEDIKKKREKYESLTWNKKAKEHNKLKDEINKHERENAKTEEIQQDLDLKKPETSESAESSLEWGLLLKQIASLEAEGQYGEIIQVLLFHYNNVIGDPDSSEKDETLLWEKLTHYRALAKEFGKGRENEEDIIDQVEDEMQEIIDQDTEVKDDLKEQQSQTLGIELTELNQRRYNNTVSASDRSKKESLQHTQDGSDAAKLTEDFYDIAKQEGNQDTVLNKHGESEDVTQIKLNDQVETSDQELQKLRRNIFKNQSKLDTKEGSSSFEIQDGKTGRLLRAEEAKQIQEKELQDLESRVTDKAIDKVQAKTGKVFDLTERIAARRSAKARELIDKKRREKLDSAA